MKTLLYILLVFSFTSCSILKKKESKLVHLKQIEVVKSDSLDIQLDLGKIMTDFREHKLSLGDVDIEFKNVKGKAKAKIRRKPKIVQKKEKEIFIHKEKEVRTKSDWKSQLQFWLLIIAVLMMLYFKIRK
ncbi:MAG: hypothetical protein N4A45_10260 [Flavobacteriales bacterium]|jgi:hypothetical protein|nr:hypothetical protein [Flavobacteriales bacterium]